MSKAIDKYQLFATEYIKDFNGKQAAIRAGYSAKTAESKGSQLLRIVKVQEFISELVAPRIEDAQDEFGELLKSLLLMANSNIYDFLDITLGGMVIKEMEEIPEECQKLIKKVEYNADKGGWIIELWDKMKAIDMLAKIKGKYAEHNKQKQTVINLEQITGMKVE